MAEDFLTPEERKSLGPVEEKDEASFVDNVTGESRPTIITAFCGYFFISWVLNIISTVGVLATLPTGMVPSFNLTGFSLLGGLALIFSLLCVVSVLGYWMMKKWGVYLYTGLAVISVIVSLINLKTVSFLFVVSLILPIVVIWSGFKYLDRMS